MRDAVERQTTEDYGPELESLRDSYRADPSNRDTAAKLAQLYTDMGWFNEACDIYRDLIRRVPDDYAILLDYGNLCFKRNDLDEARKIFTRLTTLKPRRVEGWNNLGIVCLSRNDFEAARNCFSRVLQIEPGNCGALLNMGNYYDRMGDYGAAAGMFEKAVESKRDFADGWFNLGNARMAMKNYPKAIEAFERAIRLQPEFPSAYKNLGFSHEQIEEYDEAERCYAQALEFNKTDATLYVNLANIYAKQRKYDKSKEFYLKAVRLSPREPAGWMGLRNLSLLKGDIHAYVKSTCAVLHRLNASAIADSLRRLRELRFTEGIDAVLKLADKLDVQNDEVDAERLLAYRRNNPQDGRCRALYRRLSSLPVAPPSVMQCLAEYEYLTGDYARAIDRLEKLGKDDAQAQKLLWMSLIEAGKAAKAGDLIQTFLDSHHDCFDAWFLLARIRAGENRESEARECLVKALEHGFTDLDALEKTPLLKKIYAGLSAGNA